MSTKLFVGNLSFNATENQLQDLFAPHGNVLEVDLIMDKFSGRPRGGGGGGYGGGGGGGSRGGGGRGGRREYTR